MVMIQKIITKIIGDGFGFTLKLKEILLYKNIFNFELKKKTDGIGFEGEMITAKHQQKKSQNFEN